MSEIAILLEEFEYFLFQKGYTDTFVVSAYQELCNFGYKTEADLIRMEYDNFCFTN
jgi:hypothetical protein